MTALSFMTPLANEPQGPDGNAYRSWLSPDWNGGRKAGRFRTSAWLPFWMWQFKREGSGPSEPIAQNP
jgi:hypothetical protein